MSVFTDPLINPFHPCPFPAPPGYELPKDPGFVKQQLRRCGVADRELDALGLSPDLNITGAKDGFGLIGNTGIGKTFALVQYLASQEMYLSCLWVNWPGMAETLKGWLAFKDHKQAVEWQERACEVGSLVLDDLGRERVKGDDDFSLGVLRAVLTSRYRDKKPVFWTSNLSLEELVPYLGGHMVSRILEAWPPQTVTGKDRRLAGAAGKGLVGRG